MLADLRFAIRQLIKSPGFTAVAITTLALAIGANSAIFSLARALVLRPVVSHQPEEVVSLYTAQPGADRTYRPFSYEEFATLREAEDTFVEVAAAEHNVVLVDRGDHAQRSAAVFTSENFFDLAGVSPAIGRFYDADESRPNANVPVVVLSHAFWRQIGSNADVLGSTLRINGRDFNVIGVTPKGFSGLNAIPAPHIWLPLGVYDRAGDLADPQNHQLALAARLAPGVTRETLDLRLPALAQRLNALQPSATGEPRELEAEPPMRLGFPRVRPSAKAEGMTNFMTFALVGMFGMAACVIVIASINLANMLLARGATRTRELAVRLAVGATRGQIVRQLLTEGLLLAGAGGLAGLILSVWANDLFYRSSAAFLEASEISLALDLRPDGFTLGATFLVCVVATLLFSLGPALGSSRVDVVHDLKQVDTARATSGRLHRFFSPRHCLVMAQVALSVMLLFVSALFVRSAFNAKNLERGFPTAGRVIAEIDFGIANEPTQDVVQRRLFAVLDRVRDLPRVESTAFATLLPYETSVRNGRRILPAHDSAAAASGTRTTPPGSEALYTVTSSRYFETLGVQLLRGREFTDAEFRNVSDRSIAIIDATLAQELFPGSEALGQYIQFAGSSGPSMEVVGICAPHLHDPTPGGESARVYVPYAAARNDRVFLQVRLATSDPAATAAFAPTLRAALRDFDADLPVVNLATYEAIVDRNPELWLFRIGASLFGVFGGIALVLAVVGVYGVKAHAVARRTREIGIRVALGARPRDVFALIMTQSFLQTAFALSVGLGLALACGQVLQHLIFRVSPSDPIALAFSAILLAAAALLACFLPARKATHVDPVKALRAE